MLSPRRLLACALPFAVLAACSSSSSSTTPEPDASHGESSSKESGSHSTNGGSSSPNGGGSNSSGGGGSSSGPSTGGFSAKSSLAVSSTIGSMGVGADGGVVEETIHVVGVLLTNNAAATCSYAKMIKGETELANLEALELDVASESGPVDPGTYTIKASSSSLTAASFSSTNGTCQSSDSQATAGTITIASLDASGITGSYDLTFPSGPVSGSFTAGFCSIPDAGSSRTDAAPNCVSP